MGVPPNPATQALLDQGLNIVGRVCKTSKYKFYDWNIKHTVDTTKLPDSEFKKLSRAAQFFREGHYTQEDIKKIQAEARLAKEAEKKAKEATKLAKESKNLWDKFLSKAKGTTQAVKAASAGGTVAKAGDTWRYRPVAVLRFRYAYISLGNLIPPVFLIDTTLRNQSLVSWS